MPALSQDPEAHRTPDSRARLGSAGGLAALAVLVCAVFGPVVIDRDRVLSHVSGDTSQFFYSMRKFAVDEIREGRWPLWNPYLMSGTPFVGNFQSAIFYPPNAIYLALPVTDAIDVDYALHFYLFGAFTFLWVRLRGVTVSGAFFSACMAMFGSTCLLRMLGGQLTMVQAMAWAPLLLLAVEWVFDAARERRPVAVPILVGAAATGMQVLAGHPQTVFITGFAVGLYCLVRLPGADHRLKLISSLATMAVWGPLLGAIQLLPGLHTMAEGVRTGGDKSDFSTTFSFPPENLLTLLAPAFFGDRVYYPYWGQWAPWDAVFFFGISGLALAIFASRYAPGRRLKYAPFLAILIVFLAMGPDSPVYALFAIVPIFDLLRGLSKFLFAASLFAGLLAGVGYDLLAQQAPEARPRRASLALAALVPGLALGGLAVWIADHLASGKPWRELMFREMKDSLFITYWFNPPQGFFEHAATQAAISLLLAALTALVLAVLFWRAASSRWAARGVFALGVVELVTFACLYRDTFDVRDLHPPGLERFYSEHPGEDRVIQMRGPELDYARNLPMDRRRSAVWGYEPVMLHRYAAFVAYGVTQSVSLMHPTLEHARWGSDVVEVALNLGQADFQFDSRAGTVRLPRAFDLLRVRHVLVPPGLPKSTEGIYENPNAFPRFLLLRDYVVTKTPRVIFETLDEPGFDPRRSVVLEQKPDPAPKPDLSSPEMGSVIVEDESSDRITLRVSVPQPTILLMTDPYSDGWEIRPLEGSVQTRYEVMPADFALRAVPLAAGEHHFRMQYRPRAFDVGILVTLASFTAFVAVAVYISILRVGDYVTKKPA